MTFKKNIAQSMYGVTTEEELRAAMYGTRAATSDAEFGCIQRAVDERWSSHDVEHLVYVEIGVYFGGTFAQIVRHMDEKQMGYTAYGIDLFEDIQSEPTDFVTQTHELENKFGILNVAYRDHLDQKLRDMGLRGYELIKGYSHEKVCDLDADIDVAFIDGNHTYKQTMNDLEAVLAKARKGAYIIFDNASNTHPGDRKYVESDGGPYQVTIDACRIYRDRLELHETARSARVLRVKQ